MAEDPSDDSCEFSTLFRELLKHEWGIDALSVLGESDPQSVAEPLDEEEAQYPTGYIETSSEFEEIENRVLFGAREDTESDEDDELLVSKPFSEICNIDLIRPPPVSTTKEAVQVLIETCEKEGSRDREEGDYALTMIEPERVSQYDSYDDLESFDFTEGLSTAPLLEEVEQVSRSRMLGGQGTSVAHCVQEGSQSHFTSIGDITSELQNLSLRRNEDFCHEQRTTGVSSLQSFTSETQQTNEAVVLVPCPPSPETQQTNQAVGLVPYHPSQDQEINQTGAHSFSSYTQQQIKTLTLVSYPSPSQTQETDQTVTLVPYPSPQSQQTSRTITLVSYPPSSQTQETDQTVTLVPYPSPQSQQTSRTVDLMPYLSSLETQQTSETVTLVPYLSPSQTQQTNRAVDLVSYPSSLQTQETNQTVTLVPYPSPQTQQTNRTVDLVSYPSSSQNQETSQTVTLVSYLSPSKDQQTNETVTLVSHRSSQTQETAQTLTLVPYPSPRTQQTSCTVDLVSYPSSSQTQQANRTVELVPYPSLQTLQTNQMITLVPCPSSSQTQQTNDTVNLVAYLSSQTQERNETVTLVPYPPSTQAQQTNQTVGHVSYHSSQTHKRNQALTLVPYPSSSQTQQPNQTATRVSYRSRLTRNSSSGRSANETPAALPGTSSPPENDVIVPGNSVLGHTSRATQVDNPGSLPTLHNTQNDSQSNCDSPAPESSATVKCPAEEAQAAQAAQVAQAEYTCQICQWKTADVQSMKDHYEMHKNLIKLRCKLCGKWYISAETLRRHLISGHKLAEGPELDEHQIYFVCKDCGEKFDKRGHYTSHLQAHISDYPLKCDKCTCSYPIQSHLITHKVHAHHKSYVGNLESLQMYIKNSL